MIYDMIRMILLPILFCVSRWPVKLSMCEEYFQTMDTDNSGKVTYASWLPQKRLENPYLPRAFLGISRPFAFSKFQSWIPFPTCDLMPPAANGFWDVSHAKRPPSHWKLGDEQTSSRWTVKSWQPRKSLLLACLVAMKMWVTCDRCLTRYDWDMGVSKNRGTPKSSILIGFAIINHRFWGTPIFDVGFFLQIDIIPY